MYHVILLKIKEYYIMPHHHLPTLYLTISASTFKIEKEEPGQARVALYKVQGLFAQNQDALILEGFEDFSISLDARYGLSLKLENDNYNVNIFSTQDLTICTPFAIQGICHIQAPKLINESHIVAEQDIFLGDTQNTEFRPNYNYTTNAVINHGAVRSKQGKLTIGAVQIAHEGPKAGFFSQQSMTTIGHQLVLNAPMESMHNMDIYLKQDNPNTIISNQLRARMTLTFHLNGAAPIRFENNNSWGSLTFESLDNLLCLTHQTAAGNINFITRNSAVYLGSEEEHAILRAGADIYSASSIFYFYNGCLLSEQDIHIQTENTLILGREIDQARIKAEIAAKAEALVKKQPLPKTEKTAMQSKRAIRLQSARGEVKSNCLELVTNEFSINACKWDNVSSDIVVYHNAVLALPISDHRFLVDKQAGGQRIAGGPFTCHEHYRTQGASEAALTKPCTFSIGNELAISGIMNIFASQVSCKRLNGQAPKITNFTPYTSYTDHNLGGHKKRSHSWWSQAYHTSNGTPVLGKFSVGSDLTTTTAEVKLAGILAAHQVQIAEVQKGCIGEFNWRVTLAPTLEKHFRSAVPLVEYFKESALYQASPGGETVFKALMPLPQDLAPRVPRLVLQQDGSVSYNTRGLRSIFTPKQEVKLLNDLMMGELSRHFLSAEFNDAQSILNHLEANSLEYSQQAQKLITQNTAPNQQDGPLIPMSANEITNFKLDKPCIANAVVTFVAEDGTPEDVLCPIVFFPESLNNKRLRDGAGCVFSLGDVKFIGVPGGQLEVRGNIDSQGVVTYQNFETVSRRKNTWTHYQKIVHETKQKKLFGGSKTTTHEETIVINELQPGNSTVAKGERYIAVEHIHRSGAVDILGTEGLSVEKAITFQDHAIIQPVIGAPTTKNQRGLLGMGRTTITSQKVHQKAIGSVVQSIGPIYIEAEYGRFDATQFNTDPIFDVSECHFHEALSAVKAYNRAVDAQQAEQERSNKHKIKQGRIKLAISLPLSYYLGGVASGWLGNMGVAGAQLAMAKAATMSTVSSVIQGQKPKKVFSNAFKAGALAGIDYGLNNATWLNPAIVQEFSKEAVMGTTSALLYQGNIFENVLLGRSGAATLNILKKGTIDDFVIHIGSCVFGSTIGSTLSDMGSHHGALLAATRKPAIQLELESQDNKPILWQAIKLKSKPKQKIEKLLDQEPQESGKLLLWQAPKASTPKQEHSVSIPHGYITAIEHKIGHMIHGAGVYLMPKIAVIETAIDLYQRATETLEQEPDMGNIELMTCSFLGAATHTVVNTSGNIAVISAATEMSVGTGFLGTGLAIAGAAAAFPVVDDISEAAGDLVQQGCHRVFKAF